MRWAKWQFGIFVLCIITMLLTGCITENPEYRKGYEMGYERGYLESGIDHMTCIIGNIENMTSIDECINLKICSNPLLPMSRKFKKCS